MFDLQTFYNAPPQTKAIISIIISVLSGLLVYSFIKNAIIEIIIQTIITLIFGYIFFKISQNKEEIFILIIAFFSGTIFWFYVFYENYKNQQKDKKTGKQSFICNPNGICSNDGIIGAFNGENDYIFKPPNQPGTSMQNGIPKQYFDIRRKDQYTYMFWLNIDYIKWKASRGKRNIILLKGNNVDTSDLVVWGLPADNLLQFKIKGITGKPVTMSIDFPFDKWVHYTIVVNQRVAELYKNATLEKSSIINGMINLSETPLYIGYIPDNSFKYFPGQIIYLTYHNFALNPEDIYDIYESEYRILSSQSNSWNKNNPSKKQIRKNYEEDCEFINKNNTSKINDMFDNKEDEILIPNIKKQGVNIPLPSQYLKNL